MSSPGRPREHRSRSRRPDGGRLSIRWGAQMHVRAIRPGDEGEDSDAAVSGYVAKYARRQPRARVGSTVASVQSSRSPIWPFPIMPAGSWSPAWRVGASRSSSIFGFESGPTCSAFAVTS